jgi:hypothetical protein
MAAIITLPENLSGIRVSDRDFAGQDLSGKNLSHSVFTKCSFDDANLTDAVCENSSFPGCTFRNTICYRTSFKNSKLTGVVFEPRDAYGMTISLSCDTFRGMRVSQLWYLAWLLFATQMEPAREPVKENLKDRVIAAIGAERYVKLARLFQRREL